MSHGATPDAKLSQVSTIQAAGMGAIATLVAAVIALGAATWSGRIAANAAVKAASQQQTGETDRSRAEFLRGQRQDLYGSVAAHEQALNESQESFIDHARDLTSPQLRALLKDGRNPPLLQTLENDQFRMEILGSPKVRATFSKLISAQLQRQDYFRRTLRLLSIKSDWDILRPRYERQDLMQVEIAELERQLMTNARLDMGSE
jgi:hypothetical protein